MIFNRVSIKRIAIGFISILGVELITPLGAYALTSGPSQPEVQSFEPISTTQMVDPFTGDFVYNIALMDVGGYPLNIAYHSGIGMDEEASWVGLGWNINPGSMTRQLRGIPDDFNGEQIEYLSHRKTMTDFTLSKQFKALDAELTGLETDLELLTIKNAIQSSTEDSKLKKFGAEFSITLNNYRGVGYNLSASRPGMGEDVTSQIDWGLSMSNQNGLGMNVGYSLKRDAKDKENEMRTATRTFSAGIGKTRMGANVYAGVSTAFDYKDYEINERKSKSANLMLGATTYYPGANNAYSSNRFAGSVRFGKETIGPVTLYKGPWRMEYGEQTQVFNNIERSLNAYGYLYAENVMQHEDKDNVMDVNSTQGEPFNKYSKYLPFSQHTYDPLIATGQGVSGIFRPYRNSVGQVWTNSSTSKIQPNVAMGTDVGGGAVAKFGGDIYFTIGHSLSSIWKDEELNGFTFETESNELNEPFYYKHLGDAAIADQDFYSSLLWDAPLDLRLNNLKGNFTATGDKKHLSSPSHARNKREYRNKVLQVLNESQASVIGLLKSRQNLQPSQNNFTDGSGNKTFFGKLEPTRTLTPTVSNEGRGDYYSIGGTEDRMSELIVTQEDGSRYVYGLPLINKKHVEVSFAMGSNDNPPLYNSANNLIEYTNDDNSVSNNVKGISNYYDRKEIPPYAHSFMLTAVLSADYVDVTGDGPSEDDLGNYTRFNYQRVHDNFPWRVPMASQEMMAHHNQGLLSTTMDDLASITYGEKEIWYLHSIETKTHLALFHLSERLDGLSAKGPDGGIDVTPSTGVPTGANKLLFKLDKIELYFKEEIRRDLTSAIPIKTVSFQYSYDLCPNTINNVHFERNGGVFTAGDGITTFVPTDPFVHPLYNPLNLVNPYDRGVNAKRGKLTLHKIFFSYRGNQRSKLNPYIFQYLGANPDFSYNSIDRWGTYKPNSINLPNDHFPYALQNENDANQNASAWHLTNIKLPSGADMEIDYESDDYAYVQDKKAMFMSGITGFAQWDENLEALGDVHNYLYDVGSGKNNYIVFPIDQGKSVLDYIKDIKFLYFRFRIELGNKNGSVDQEEFIPGFVEINKEIEGEETQLRYGDFVKNGVNLGYVRIHQADLAQNEHLNPITKTAFQFTRQNTPWIAFPGSDYKNSSLTGATKTASVLFAVIPEALKMLVGQNNAMIIAGKSRMVNIEQSLIRLNVPDGVKYGGGCRVSRISFNDNWSTNSSAQDQTVGQVFDYTTQDLNGNTISSGVALWEPESGGDENPHRLPVYRREKNILAPDNNPFNYQPIGEEYYPSANVGYSKITSRSLKPSDIGYNLTTDFHSTGYSVQEFYTAQDFPTITRTTTIKRHVIPRLPASLLLGSTFEMASGTQGISVILNDMHGKPKRTSTYDIHDNLITQSSHEYQFDEPVDPDEGVNELRNEVDVLNRDGTVGKAKFGYEMEVVANTHRSYDISGDLQVSPNADGITPGIFIPSMWAVPCYHQKTVKTAAITKIINRKGILKATEVYNLGSTLRSENLAYDGESGQLLLTRTQNEFGNYTYSLSIPAYWAYDRMGAAYTNIGANKALNLSSGNGTVTFSDQNIFVKGDELLVWNNTSGEYEDDRFWVLDVHENGSTSTSISIIDRLGVAIPNGDYKIKIIRSGRRNLLVASIGAISLQSNPIIDDGQGNITWNNYDAGKSLNDEVLMASALEFGEIRRQYPNKPLGTVNNCCGDNPDPATINFIDDIQNGDLNYYYVNKIVNPYVSGLWGNWYPTRSFAFNDKQVPERSTSMALTSSNLNNSDISKDGAYTQFDFFWKFNSAISPKWWQPGSDDNTDVSNPWVWGDFNVITDRNGFGIQSQNAIGVNSSALYGYDRLLPVAVASNSKPNEMLFDGFEDYYNMTSMFNCLNNSAFFTQDLVSRNLQTTRHWDLWHNLKPNVCEITNEEAHTGKYSLKLINGDVDINFKDITPSSPNSGTPLTQYKVQKEDLVPTFNPSDNTYVLSYWIKVSEDAVAPQIQMAYVCPTFDPNCVGGASNSITLNNIKTGIKINGWQRVSCEFFVDGTINYDNIHFTILNPSSTDSYGNKLPVYIDDIRFFPKQGELLSYVYDQKINRLMATLDNNNYATFYEYDEQGNLVRTKVETEKGIYTVEENRSHIAPNN